MEKLEATNTESQEKISVKAENAKIVNNESGEDSYFLSEKRDEEKYLQPFSEGHIVKIKRGEGVVEKDWIVDGVYNDGRIIVVKKDEKIGQEFRELIPRVELLSVNSMNKPIDFSVDFLKQRISLFNGIIEQNLDPENKEEFMGRIAELQNKIKVINKKLEEVKKEHLEQKESRGEFLFEDALIGNDFRKIFDKYDNKEAYEAAVGTGVLLISMITKADNLKDVRDLLAEANFNSEKKLSDRDEFLADTSLKLMERVTGKKFGENQKDSLDLVLSVWKSLEPFYFHGTNQEAGDYIKKEGLSRTKRVYKSEEIENILKILKGIGESEQVFGWYKINSENKIFVEGSTERAYNYAVRSPEWFDEFSRLGGQMRGGIDYLGFINRDYEKAKELFLKKLKEWKNRSAAELAVGKKNLGTDEESTIVDFFDKYWQKFGKDEAVVLKIKESTDRFDSAYDVAAMLNMHSEFTNENIYKLPEDKVLAYLKEHGNPESLKMVLESLIYGRFHKADQRIENRDIAPEDIEAFTVPVKSKFKT